MPGIYPVFSSLEKKENSYRLKSVFLLCLERNESQTFERIAAMEKLSSNVYVIGTTCFD